MKKSIRKMNVILYVRVSTKEQVDNYSLSSQEKICREYCERQGWKVIKVFREEGESAKTADRHQLLQLIEYCHKNKGLVDILLVYKFDRFSRQSADHHAVKATLLKLGVKLCSATEVVDETPGGKFMETILAGFAQFDNDVRSERTVVGMKEKVRQGQWAWKAPIGYKNSPAGMIVDEDRSSIIKRAFNEYAKGGYTIKAIAKKMNNWGLRTEKGNKITPQLVFKVFNNKLYCGVIEAWGETHEGVHPPLISKSLFRKVNSIRLGKSVNAAIPHFTNNYLFPLKNILKCGECGKNLTGSKSKGRSKRYAYYHCVCGAVRVRKEIIENKFYDYLKEIQPNKDLIKFFKLILTNTWKKKHLEAGEAVERVDKEINNLKMLKQKLLQKNLEGIVSNADYMEQVKICNENITVKEIERSDYREREANADHVVSLVESLFENVASLWFEASFENKQRFQSLLLPAKLAVNNQGFGTATLGLPFNLIRDFAGDETTLVTPREFESRFPG